MFCEKLKFQTWAYSKERFEPEFIICFAKLNKILGGVRVDNISSAKIADRMVVKELGCWNFRQIEIFRKQLNVRAK